MGAGSKRGAGLNVAEAFIIGVKEISSVRHSRKVFDRARAPICFRHLGGLTTSVVRPAIGNDHLGHEPSSGVEKVAIALRAMSERHVGPNDSTGLFIYFFCISLTQGVTQNASIVPVSRTSLKMVRISFKTVQNKVRRIQDPTCAIRLSYRSQKVMGELELMYRFSCSMWKLRIPRQCVSSQRFQCADSREKLTSGL